MLKSNRNKYVKSTKANNIQKIFLRFSLGLFVAILTVMLSNSGFISHASFAAVPSGQQTAFTSVAELVQAGKKSYQAGQFANAIELWSRASELLPQGDTINQAVVLTNLPSSYQQLGEWQQANAAISQSLKLLEKSTNQNILAGALSIQHRETRSESAEKPRRSDINSVACSVSPPNFNPDGASKRVVTTSLLR